jgi:hypothetical protein
MSDKRCSVEGCESKQYHARGLCHNHYQQLRAKPDFVPRVPSSQIMLRSDSLKAPSLTEGQQANLCSLVRSLRP